MNDYNYIQYILRELKKVQPISIFQIKDLGRKKGDEDRSVQVTKSHPTSNILLTKKKFLAKEGTKIILDLGERILVEWTLNRNHGVIFKNHELIFMFDS